MKKYFRILPGKNSVHADECIKGSYIGLNNGIDVDISHHLPENYRDFNNKFIPIWMQNNPGKTKVVAGLSCGQLWTLAKYFENGDVILCSDGSGKFYIGEVSGDYSFHSGETLPHRRTVHWSESTIDRSIMSTELRTSIASGVFVNDITKYGSEIEKLIKGNKSSLIVVNDDTVEDPSVFVLEKHLEDFLVHNWKQTEIGKSYDIYEADGEIVGQQYMSDTGPIDILAVRKDKKELLVIELKKGRASDSVVGQIQRYMGYVLEELAEEGQTVKGIIIAQDDDIKIQRALKVTTNIEFYRYQVSFKLTKS